AELGDLGVARVSTGSLPYTASLYAAAQAARAVRDDAALPPSTPYPELQARLVAYEKHSRRDITDNKTDQTIPQIS
ncbi:MAG TPA: hypothetical protein VN871_19625, partial [Mycobacterium sp.]|nr:hypothetical protein [Mycobacterium sp.]